MTTSREKDPFGPSPEQQRQRQIFVTTFSMLAKLMYIDGKTSREEARILDTIMDHELELTAERKRFAIEVIRLARDDGQTFEDHARRFQELFGTKPEMYSWIVDILTRLASADGSIDDSEDRLLKSAAEVFKLPEESVSHLRRQHQPLASATDFATLGVQHDTTAEEIDARYQQLREQYDVSRLRDQNVPDELIALAEKRLEEFEAAYKRVQASAQRA